MGDTVEQEIRVKIKGLLEGFDSLKQVKNELRGIANEKVTVGKKGEIKELASEVRNYNKELADGVQINRGFFGTIAQIITVAGSLGNFLQGAVSAFKFLGITGAQVTGAIKGGLTSISSAATGAFNTVRGAASSAFSSLTTSAGGGAGGGVVATLANAFRGLGGAATESIPALASGAVAIGGVTAAAVAALAAVVAIIAALAAVEIGRAHV